MSFNFFVKRTPPVDTTGFHQVKSRGLPTGFNLLKCSGYPLGGGGSLNEKRSERHITAGEIPWVTHEISPGEMVKILGGGTRNEKIERHITNLSRKINFS